MHGTIAYRNRKLNDMLGWLAISAYAWCAPSLERAWRKRVGQPR